MKDGPSQVLELLVEDLLPYNATVIGDNVAGLLVSKFVEIIRSATDLTSPNSLEKQKQSQSSSNLKTQYEIYLLQESNSQCVNKWLF